MIKTIRKPKKGDNILQSLFNAVNDIIDVLPSLEIRGDGKTTRTINSSFGTTIHSISSQGQKLAASTGGSSIDSVEYQGTFKVIKRNIALMNPPEGGWTSENMPEPVYKITVVDGYISDDTLLTTSISNLQAGYAQYNGAWILVQGVDLDLPSEGKYVCIAIEYNAQGNSFTSSIELKATPETDRTALKQYYPIAKITFDAVDENDPSDEATLKFNACQISQYPISVPQLWCFKQCIDEEEPT